MREFLLLANKTQRPVVIQLAVIFERYGSHTVLSFIHESPFIRAQTINIKMNVEFAP